MFLLEWNWTGLGVGMRAGGRSPLGWEVVLFPILLDILLPLDFRMGLPLSSFSASSTGTSLLLFSLTSWCLGLQGSVHNPPSLHWLPSYTCQSPMVLNTTTMPMLPAQTCLQNPRPSCPATCFISGTASHTPHFWNWISVPLLPKLLHSQFSVSQWGHLHPSSCSGEKSVWSPFLLSCPTFCRSENPIGSTFKICQESKHFTPLALPTHLV